MTTAKRSSRQVKRAFIGPVAMLVVGAAASALLWRTLMLEPPDGVGQANEQLSWKDRQALDRLMRAPGSR